MPIMNVNEGYDGVCGVYVAYKEENQSELKFAVKIWRIETGPMRGHTRLNVYADDAIYKYISGGRGYIPLEEDGRPWPLPWVDPRTGQPIGITVIHFDIRKSIIHDLINFQDALNKAAIDEMAGADIEGFGMITLSGGMEPVDSDGNSTLSIGPRRVLYAPEGTWGTISSGDIAALSSLVDKAIQRLAQRARIPLKYFQVTGQVSSADSQNADDSGMVSLITGIARRAGNAWEDVMDACRRVNNAFGDAPFPDGRITAVWNSFERVDRIATETARSQIVANLVNAGATIEGAARVAGYSDDEVTDLMRGDMVDGIAQ